MDKLKMHSPNIVDQNIDKLAQLFPNCVTETKGDDGKLRKAIDFDQLKQELSRNIVEGPQERYQLNWPGKREALLTANAPIAKTLRPCREESVNFDTTENLFIEGDNLDALKLLQETYLGKVKVIYIDPPYNTGNDFIYEDDFAQSIDDYVERSNQKDTEGNRLVANTESNGRFHSDWLSMMYSRIKLSKEYLSDDGVLFISIDESEVSNLAREAAIKWSAAPDMTPQTVLYRRPVAQFSNFQPKIVSSWLILALFQANFLISGRSRLCPYQLVNSNQVRQGE
ncbi:hypothetical protein AYI77_19105 [Shewanella algae]|nr:hypothetical protein AYI77_19105 [Shewanella algae]